MELSTLGPLISLGSTPKFQEMSQPGSDTLPFHASQWLGGPSNPIKNILLFHPYPLHFSFSKDWSQRLVCYIIGFTF